MKKIILVAIALVASLSVEAQQATFSFESSANWWVHPTMRSYVSLSKEQAAEGTTSIKFECMDFDGFDVINATMPSSASNIVSLDEGKYTMKVSVYRGEKAPTGFMINFKESPTSQYIPTVWNITKVERGKWVELSQDIEISQSTDVILAILLRNVKPWRAEGTLYIDNIKIEKK